MCYAWVPYAAAALGAYGTKRQADSNQRAQLQAFDADTARNQQEFTAQLNTSRDKFAAQTQKDNADLVAAQINAARNNSNLVNRIKADKDEFNERERAAEVAVSPTEDIADVEANAAAIASAQGSLESVIDQSESEGGQDLGASDESFGKVSEEFSAKAEGAKESNIKRAKTRASRIGTGVGIGNIQRDNAISIADKGLDANLIRGEATRNKLFSDQALSRQQQLNDLLFGLDTQANQGRFNNASRFAEINNAIAPAPIQFFDSTNRSAQLYSLLGSLGAAAGGFSGGGGGGTTSSGAGML